MASILCAEDTPAPQDSQYLIADATLIMLSGVIQSVVRGNFILDYGEGAIAVEMDDGDREADGSKVKLAAVSVWPEMESMICSGDARLQRIPW
jgi:hypothetical protein